MIELATPDLSGAEFTIDEAAFRRVWERVMPDQTLSPITLRTSEPTAEKLPTPPKESPPIAPDHYIAGLEVLMDELTQWLGRYLRLSRHTAGKTASTLRTVAQTTQKQLKTLSTIYYLLVGSPYLPRSGGSELGVCLTEGLRRAFLQEMTWAKQYAHMSEKLDDPILRESAQELYQRGLENGRLLRNLVERGAGT